MEILVFVMLIGGFCIFVGLPVLFFLALLLSLFGVTITTQALRDGASRLPALLVELATDPTDRAAQARLLQLLENELNASDSDLRNNKLDSGSVYAQSLRFLESHPDAIGVREFALKVGRWHFSRGRKDRRPTIYDEQAISNDIVIRITGLAVR